MNVLEMYKKDFSKFNKFDIIITRENYMQNYSQIDFKKTIKRGLIYLLIATPFMLVVAVLLTIVKAPYWLTMLSTVVIGGIAVFICYIVNAKLDEKRKKKQQNSNKFDPFKD